MAWLPSDAADLSARPLSELLVPSDPGTEGSREIPDEIGETNAFGLRGDEHRAKRRF
jgi:hypothetical protein